MNKPHNLSCATEFFSHTKIHPLRYFHPSRCYQFVLLPLTPSGDCGPEVSLSMYLLWILPEKKKVHFPLLALSVKPYVCGQMQTHKYLKRFWVLLQMRSFHLSAAGSWISMRYFPAGEWESSLAEPVPCQNCSPVPWCMWQFLIFHKLVSITTPYISHSPDFLKCQFMTDSLWTCSKLQGRHCCTPVPFLVFPKIRYPHCKPLPISMATRYSPPRLHIQVQLFSIIFQLRFHNSLIFLL